MAKLWHVHLAFNDGRGREWVLPPMTMDRADEAIKDAKRGGLRAWRTVAPDYNLEPTHTAADDTMKPEKTG